MACVHLLSLTYFPGADTRYPSCSKVVRKSIALVLTVISQNQKKALREAYSKKVWQCAMQVQPRA